MPQGSLQWIYYTDPAPGPTTVNLGQDTVRLGQGMAAGMESSAETAQTATSSLEVDDPDGTWDFTGLHSFYAVENAAPSGHHRLWTGILGERVITRGLTGPADSLRTGVARRWQLNLEDHNEILGRRVMIGAAAPSGAADNANRPAETLAARLTWLLASPYLFSGMDQGLVQYPTDALDANNYDGSFPVQMLQDMMAVVGYLCFAKHNETSGTPELAFFDPDDTAIFPASATFSNALADLSSSSVLPIEPDAELHIDPGRVFSGVYFQYANGHVYRTLASTAAAFGGWRDTTSSNMSVKTATLANKVADRYLATLATESERYIWTSQVPAAHVNDVLEGQSTTITETHLPNTGAPGRPIRILRRNVMANQPTDEFYWVRYEAVPIVLPPQGAFDHYASGAPNHTIPPLPHATTPGHRLVTFVTQGYATGQSGEPTVRDGDGTNTYPWTKAFWVEAQDTTQYGGPGNRVGAGIYWREVAVGETTTTPLEVVESSPANSCEAWLWEFDMPGDPGASVSYTTGVSTGSGIPTGTDATIGTALSGFILGGGVLQEVDYEYAPVVTAVTGTEVQNTDALNVPGAVRKPWPTPWQWIATEGGGGPLVANLFYNDSGSGSSVNRFGFCGGAIELPGVTVVPTIPWPANQVG